MKQMSKSFDYWLFAVLPLFFGILLSTYAIYVEYYASIDENFEALCDFSEEVSCSKVFLSEYGKIFSKLGIVPKDSILDLPNAFYGLLFYLFYLIFYLFIRHSPIGRITLLSMTVFSLAFSAYLAYILAEILHEMCVVCASTYVCNFLLFIGSARLNLQSEDNDSSVPLTENNNSTTTKKKKQKNN